MRIRLWPAIVVPAALLIISSHARAADWIFNILAQSDSQLNKPTTAISLSLFAVPPISPDPGYSGTVTTPDGSSTGTFIAGSAQGTLETFSSFTNFLSSSAATGKWPLSATDETTSNYDLSLNFSGINVSSIPRITITSPASNESTPNQTPTFTWNDSGDFDDLTIQLTNTALGVDYFQPLPSTETSWTVPADLSPATYQMSVQVLAPDQFVPLTAALLSGPSIGLPDAATFIYFAEASQSITIVPEPTSLALAATLPLLLLRRRRQ